VSERGELAAIALLVAEEAAAVLASGYRSRPKADEKARHDLVTEFDRRSEALLVTRLRALTPEIPVVGEEATAAGETKRRAGLVWYVDPLDGTTNFVHGHPFFCVSVGLMEDDRPVAGAVVAPALALRWVGWLAPAGGAHVATRNGVPCAVSTTAKLGDALVGTGFPPQRDRAPDNNFDSFLAVKRVAQAVRRCGSAAVDLCLVADGTYDGYWERRLHAWDTAAGSAIVLAAGGTVTALDGGQPDLHVGHIVASNGLVHGEIVATLARVERSG
jgi:myo-inositol-1(or 4)-monophosphatase